MVRVGLLAGLLVLSFGSGAAAQEPASDPEAAAPVQGTTVHIVPNDEFCAEVADDPVGCERLLTVMADMHALPAAFEDLVSSAPVVCSEGVTFSGTGAAETETFVLAGGDYGVTYVWDSGCMEFYSGATLYQTDSEEFFVFFPGYMDIPSLEEGRYHWVVDPPEADNCNWILTIAPLSD